MEEAASAAPSAGKPVTLIKGIGRKVAKDLASHGVETVDQLATWTLSDFGEKLPRLTARASNGDWIKQAAALTGS